MKRIGPEIIGVLALGIGQSLGCSTSTVESRAGGELALPHHAVGPEGAALDFPGGSRVVLPAGAVTETTSVEARAIYIDEAFPSVDVEMSGDDFVHLDPTRIRTDETRSVHGTATAGTREGVALVHAESYILYPTKLRVDIQPGFGGERR